jgi:multidrug efflux pump subunit AcrA (membrane-fusion protein)
VLSRGDITDLITAQGTVTPTDSTVISASTTGFLKNALPTAGSVVAEGKTLFELDDAQYQKQLEDQIKSLKLQQSSLYSQYNGNVSEITLSREQLNSQLLSARQQYETCSV